MGRRWRAHCEPGVRLTDPLLSDWRRGSPSLDSATLPSRTCGLSPSSRWQTPQASAFSSQRHRLGLAAPRRCQNRRYQTGDGGCDGDTASVDRDAADVHARAASDGCPHGGAALSRQPTVTCLPSGLVSRYSSFERPLPHASVVSPTLTSPVCTQAAMWSRGLYRARNGSCVVSGVCARSNVPSVSACRHVGQLVPFDQLPSLRRARACNATATTICTHGRVPSCTAGRGGCYGRAHADLRGHARSASGEEGWPHIHGIADTPSTVCRQGV